MPDHKIHRLIDKLLLGKEYPYVHKFADLILGKGHREKWGHKPSHILLTYLLTNDIDALISHILHIKSDKEICLQKKKS